MKLALLLLALSAAAAVVAGTSLTEEGTLRYRTCACVRHTYVRSYIVADARLQGAPCFVVL